MTHTAKAERATPVETSSIQLATEPRLTETTPTRITADPEPQATPSQPVILEVRVTKQSNVQETGKPAIPKESISSEAPASEPEAGSPITPPIKQTTKPEFSTGEHKSEHKDEQPVSLLEQQRPVHHEPVSTPISNLEQERSTPVRAVSHDSASRVFSPPDIPEPAAADHTPLKSMDLRIPDANGGTVTVRLQERAGGVHVSVRSNDTQLANGVAAHLPELSRNLDRQGFNIETWTPGEAHRIADAAPEALLREASIREHAVDVTRGHIDTASPITPEQTQSGNESSDGHRKPDWQEEMYKRPRRPSDENFKEYLS